MIQLCTYTTTDLCPTQHAMVIVWGHFARTLGLLDHLATLPSHQKTLTHAPHEKIVEFLIGLLSGMEQLTDLSSGPSPLVCDHAVATAWQVQTFAAASTVSRTLKASDRQTVTARRLALDAIGHPFLDRAIAEMRERYARLLLDADLTGRPLSSTSSTYPDAAFGYMDGELRLGYQLAEICGQTRLFGRQCLSARQHPGSTVSGPGLLELIEDAERRLSCHPRRRIELLEQRLAASRQAIAEEERLAAIQEQRSLIQTQRLERLARASQTAPAQIEPLQAGPLSRKQGGPDSQLSRLQAQVAGWQRQPERARSQRVHADAVASRQRARAQTLRQARDQLPSYVERLCQEHADAARLVPCTIRLDAAFSGGENLTALIELGYEGETKSGNHALVQALRKQVSDVADWERVGKNAEMIGWTNYRIHTCPQPLTVALERFSTPRGQLHAVLIRNQQTPQTPCPDLACWFQAYNAIQTIEAGNQAEQTTFKVQHLMSRSAAGIEIQALLTVLAANFVRWASAWVRARVEYSSPQFERILTSPKRLVRVAATSPATIDQTDGCVRVCFSPRSSLNGVVICVSGRPDFQLSLPVLANHQFSSA